VLIVDDHAEFREAASAAVVLLSSRGAAADGARVAPAPATGFLAKHALSGEALAALVG
jgi:hypothetical protein